MARIYFPKDMTASFKGLKDFSDALKKSIQKASYLEGVDNSSVAAWMTLKRVVSYMKRVGSSSIQEDGTMSVNTELIRDTLSQEIQTWLDWTTHSTWKNWNTVLQNLVDNTSNPALLDDMYHYARGLDIAEAVKKRLKEVGFEPSVKPDD